MITRKRLKIVSKYMMNHRKPPSQSWRTFLKNHGHDIVSVDLFTVPTATFRVLYVFLVLSNKRRRIVHFNVTDSPSAVWIGQQIVEAFPWNTAPKYLLRDRDKKVRKRIRSPGRIIEYQTGVDLNAVALAEPLRCRSSSTLRQNLQTLTDTFPKFGRPD